MLKIYLRTLKYEIHNEDKVVELNTHSHYVIRNENDAVPEVIEFGAYTDEAHAKYIYDSYVKQTRNGKRSYFYGWPREVYLREWDAPNAKLVIHIAHKDKSCTMKELMDLPADEVIAYLKQEGMNLVVPS